MITDVTRDAEGLRQAIGELLEQAYASARVTRSLDDSDDAGRDRIFGSLPQLTLSPGYYKCAEYLLWLEKCKNSGLVESAFSMAEGQGLMAVADARREFERNHPPCGVCGALQESPFSVSCCKCSTDFVRRNA
jgi:hypothetical protein